MILAARLVWGGKRGRIMGFRKVFAVLWLLAGGLFLAWTAAAQERGPIPQKLTPTEQVIHLQPGFSSLVEVNQPFSVVSIGNPAVADVSAQTDQAVFLIGKAVGRTNLLILDSSRRTVIFSATVVVGSPRATQGDMIIHNDRKGLTPYHSYSCNPNCSLVGRVEPPKTGTTPNERHITGGDTQSETETEAEVDVDAGRTKTKSKTIRR